MYRTWVLNVVGLMPSLLGPATPHLTRLAREGGVRPLRTILPAVTCAVQSTFTTGLLPRDHGCVANGWYIRELAEIAFWRQSNHLVHGDKIWEAAARLDPTFTCAKLFWWYNMYSTAAYTATPRPIYPADGRKIPDIYTQPPELREELTQRLGPFPLFHFWGPAADRRSSEWIARCTAYVDETRRPTLTLVYLPHLDYNLQRLGPRHPDLITDLAAIDEICGELIDRAQRRDVRVVVLSEYGVNAVTAPVHLNRALREAGWLRVRDELGQDKLDAGASDAFAVADHQVAHVYVRRSDMIPAVKSFVETLPGVERVLDEEGKREQGLDHSRAGELVAISAADRWFTYYFWLDDDRAPDYARTVDIHRKPGYDPVELFLDPALRMPSIKIGWTLLKKSLGFRTLMDVIPLDATLVKGSHGRVHDLPDDGPLLISSEPSLLPHGPMHASDVKELILAHLFKSTRRTSGAANPALTGEGQRKSERGECRDSRASIKHNQPGIEERDPGDEDRHESMRTGPPFRHERQGRDVGGH